MTKLFWNSRDRGDLMQEEVFEQWQMGLRMWQMRCKMLKVTILLVINLLVIIIFHIFAPSSKKRAR